MPFDTSDAKAKDEALCKAIVDMRPAMTKAVVVVADGIEANFRSESSAGEAWKPLAASTVAQRERKGYGGEHAILQRDGTLKNTASAYRNVERDGAEVGPDGCDYAGAHLGGNDGFGGGRLPVRDFLAQTDLTIDAIDRAILDHLEANDG